MWYQDFFDFTVFVGFFEKLYQQKCICLNTKKLKYTVK